MEAVLFHGLSPFFSNNNQRRGHSTLLLVYLDCFSPSNTYGTVLSFWYWWIKLPKFLHCDWSIEIPFMVMVWILCPNKQMSVVGFVFVVQSCRLLIESDWVNIITVRMAALMLQAISTFYSSYSEKILFIPADHYENYVISYYYCVVNHTPNFCSLSGPLQHFLLIGINCVKK